VLGDLRLVELDVGGLDRQRARRAAIAVAGRLGGEVEDSRRSKLRLVGPRPAPSWSG